ncbi:OLC1v1027285C1 [Oldenlandia corymbosa var. corymbosa]|uniref:OLC1v1027285C1 n=1 Tax=Oldenlandia corymbosa var. corymbosa TaxID=529605 RepID=A0AAV1CAA0_OLDCO|nr:OLC1v1027285C1 [Oldenlandia corymbosa var. corymbosa]
MEVLVNPILIPTAAFAAVLTVFIVKTAAKRGGSGEKKRRYQPVAGTIFHLLINFNRLHHYLTDQSRKYKSFRILNFTRSEVFTADPANVEYILKTNFPNYGRGSYHHSILEDLLGDGIFAVDGEKWRHQRKTSSYEFSTKILRDFSSVVFKTNASKLATAVSDAVNSTQTIEIQDLFMKSALDSVFKVVLGVELDNMCGTTEEGTRFSRCFEEASAITFYRYVDVFWPLKRLLNIGSEAKLKNNIKVIDEFVYNIIKSKTEQLHKSRGDWPMKKEDLLSRLLEKNETDPKYLKDIILSFIIAGKDTTASTLSWFFYMMCKHPSIQNIIAEEVAIATNTNESSCIVDIAKNITEEALEKMQYLHAALTETLRLYPAVPLDGKLCFSDDTLPDGFCIRKGDTISYQPWAMGRMKFIWGDDAEEFRPERWLDANGVFQQESPFKFPAFQAGPRICLGKEFAYRQMKTFSAVLLGSFILELSEEQKSIKYKTMLTLHLDGGLNLTASNRYKVK